MTVIEYVTEEVSRQGHDVHNLDGIVRVGWMLEAWAYALRADMARGKPSLDHDDVQTLGTIIEPLQNSEGLRHIGVTVGGRRCPHPQQVPSLLTALWLQIDALTPLAFYKEFEQIHPFVDGNGRTGKILLNWLNHSLLQPIFPPADLWGQPIRNP